MDRTQFEHVCRAATDAAGVDRVLVLGSQAIHGAVDDVDPLDLLTRSMELDVVAIDDIEGEAAQKITAQIGRDSPFHHEHGYYADGMELDEAHLPPGWEGRLRSLSGVSVVDEREFTVYCPEIHDLCSSKLVAGRDKDVAFVRVLASEGLVNRQTLVSRIESMDAVPGAETALRRAKAPNLTEPPDADALSSTTEASPDASFEAMVRRRGRKPRPH